jgi:hypothetical protein
MKKINDIEIDFIFGGGYLENKGCFCAQGKIETYMNINELKWIAMSMATNEAFCIEACCFFLATIPEILKQSPPLYCFNGDIKRCFPDSLRGNL